MPNICCGEGHGEMAPGDVCRVPFSGGFSNNIYIQQKNKTVSRYIKAQTT